jgi:hypothetical protein
MNPSNALAGSQRRDALEHEQIAAKDELATARVVERAGEDVKGGAHRPGTGAAPSSTLTRRARSMNA